MKHRAMPCSTVWRAVLPRAVLLALVLMLLRGCLHPVPAAEPPMQLLIDRAAVLYAPNGQRIHVPAGAVMDACGAVPAVYDLAGRTIRISEPCEARPVFRDGFEGD